MSTDQASKDRAVAVLLEIAEDTSLPSEERASAAQAVLMGDSFGVSPAGLDSSGADAILREVVADAVKAEREKVAE